MIASAVVLPLPLPVLPTSVPAPGPVARAAMAAVRAYRLVLSPWLGNGCRFEPTCSAYALDALRLHGATSGSWLAVRRIARCHPWCAGGCDPVPLPMHGGGHHPTAPVPTQPTA